jgi:DNA-binding MarR family transcriptional regulator
VYIDRRLERIRELPANDTDAHQDVHTWRRFASTPIAAQRCRIDCDAAEFDVLATLRLAGSPHRLRPTEIYQALVIASGGPTARLARLERAGLVARIRSEEDARSVLVELTGSGRDVVHTAFEGDMKLEHGILAGLQPAERKTLARLLAKLARHVESHDG